MKYIIEFINMPEQKTNDMINYFVNKKIEFNCLKSNKEFVLEQIAKMICSGEIPNEIYDKYLAKTPIGFMNEKDLINYLLDNLSLNDEIEIIEEQKKIEIPKHIPNEFIQSLNNGLCSNDVKCIAHKVNELINYLQHINKGDNNE